MQGKDRRRNLALELGHKIVQIDTERCGAVAAVLRSIHVPPPKEEKVHLRLPPEHLPNFYFAVVAICHQTSPLSGPKLGGVLISGSPSFGWDYLRLRLAERGAEGIPVWEPMWWSATTGAVLAELLKDGRGGGDISTPERRAELLRDLAVTFGRLGVSSVAELYRRTGGRLQHGLLDALKQFDAYSDPAEKKSSFFLQLMRSECCWKYADPENLGPPVDYHEIRGHLRIGTVRVIDETLADRMRNGETISAEEDVAIRRAIFDAIVLISRLAENRGDPAALHYFFWNVFRACCPRQNPHCHGCGADCALPPRYRTAPSCVLAPACSSRDAAYKPVDYVTETEYY